MPSLPVLFASLWRRSGDLRDGLDLLRSELLDVSHEAFVALDGCGARQRVERILRLPLTLLRRHRIRFRLGHDPTRVSLRASTD